MCIRDRGGANLAELLNRNLREMDTVLYKTNSLLESFFPFTLYSSNAWAPGLIDHDVARWNGLWNTGFREIEAFRAKGDPLEGTGYATYVPEPGQELSFGGTVSDLALAKGVEDLRPRDISFDSHFVRPRWAEIRNATCYFRNTDDSGHNGSLISFMVGGPHRFSHRYFIGDGGNVYAVNESNDYPEQDNRSKQLVMYWHSKFMWNRTTRANSGPWDWGAAKGVLDPNLLRAAVPSNALVRLTRLECETDWNYALLRRINEATIGGSLRSIRALFSNLRDEGVSGQ